MDRHEATGRMLAILEMVLERSDVLDRWRPADEITLRRLTDLRRMLDRARDFLREAEEARSFR